jgi:uncharacterized linocin/CFP29 family protein
MNHLLRELAPLSSRAWKEVDQEAKTRLETYLAGRKFVDFGGPHGWKHSSTSLGRVRTLGTEPATGVEARQRRVMPFVELRIPFTLSRAAVADLDRGADDVDLESLDAASRQMAVAENMSIFHGFDAAGIEGMSIASSHQPLALAESSADYPTSIAEAVNRLRLAGVEGPYGLALDPDKYTAVVDSAEVGGHAVRSHLERILQGPIVWAPGVEGAVVMSTRGGDFLFESGQDLSIGYLDSDAETVTLYLEESFSFHVADGDAAIALR